jgi:threonine/homoserine/homoserine lactone efflux protein
VRLAAVLGFLAVVAPISMSPGTSLTLVVSRVTTAGRRPGWWVVAGTVTGLYVHGLLAAAGLAALVLHSAQAFRLVQSAGAAYLAGLGLWMIWSTVRRREPPAPRRRRIGLRHPYGQALLGNVLNPKAASIYLTLAPQFLEPGRPVWAPMTVLVTTHAVFVAGWLGTWILVSSAGARLLRTDRARRMINRAGGAILVALGLRSAVSLA